jgi:rod shape-determining protein MreC
VQTLIAFIRVFREYITLTVLSGLSIILIANTLQSSSNWIATLLSSDQDAETLRDVNVSLMEEVMQLRRLRQENMELRRKIGFRDRSNWPIVPAEIIGKNLSLGQNMITLDVGEDDSIKVNMPVINEEGLVGKIVATSASYSIAMLALHRDFRVTAKIKRSRIDGFIAWIEGESLILQNVFKTSDVLPGDTVVTSEYSHLFPPEIMIGTIRGIGPGEGGSFSKIEIEPRVNFSSLERVFVVRYRGEPQRVGLENRIYPNKEKAP